MATDSTILSVLNAFCSKFYWFDWWRIPREGAGAFKIGDAEGKANSLFGVYSAGGSRARGARPATDSGVGGVQNSRRRNVGGQAPLARERRGFDLEHSRRCDRPVRILPAG